jgi:hypothetical protein
MLSMRSQPAMSCPIWILRTCITQIAKISRSEASSAEWVVWAQSSTLPPGSPRVSGLADLPSCGAGLSPRCLQRSSTCYHGHGELSAGSVALRTG